MIQRHWRIYKIGGCGDFAQRCCGKAKSATDLAVWVRENAGKGRGESRYELAQAVRLLTVCDSEGHGPVASELDGVRTNEEQAVASVAPETFLGRSTDIEATSCVWLHE